MTMCLVAAIAHPRSSSAQTYLAYVASESTDEIAVVRFDSSGARVVRKHSVGVMPADIDGPHGVALTPDGRFYYVTLGHGSPFGSLWKYDAVTDSALGHVTLGSFPASVSLTPDGAFAYVANFALHAGMVASSVSIVATDAMLEVGRITTCMMPHGSRVDPRGERHYSVCMMDNQLVEIDASRLELARTLALGDGCSPTWAEPAGASIWVACNGSSELVEVDRTDWRVKRRFAAGDGIYNLAVTSDRLLVIATNKRGQSISMFHAASGREIARMATSRTVVHGIALSADDRYAFVTVEGVGAQPGAVDVFDLRLHKRVTSVDVGAQAAGIAMVSDWSRAAGDTTSGAVQWRTSRRRQHTPGFFPLFGIHGGAPLDLWISAGVAKHHQPRRSETWRGPGVMGEVGPGGARGMIGVYHLDSWAGGSLQAGYLRTWRRATRIGPGQNFVGVEVRGMFLLVNAGVGAYWNVRHDSEPRTVANRSFVAASLGLGF